MLDFNYWDKTNVKKFLDPLNIRFQISDNGFKWDECGENEHLDGLTF